MLAIALTAGAAALRAAPASDARVFLWPKGDLSRRVQAWFAQLGADDETARAFFRDHYSPSAPAQWGEER